MGTFPRLKTGAVLQYPTQRGLRRPVRVFRFLDGSEQRYALEAAERRRWTIELDLLDDREAAKIEEFLKGAAFAGGTFSFEDPWDGSIHPKCRLAGGIVEVVCSETDRNRTRIEIVEEPE